MKLTKMAGFYKPLHDGLPAKLYRIMRLTALLLFVACMDVQAHGYGQDRLTLSEKDAPLPKIFQAIEHQSDYHFFYDYNVLPPAAKVSLDVKNASIEQVLEICFKDQPLAYSIVGRLVVVKEKEGKTKIDAGSPGVIQEFRGVITNEKGEVLAGASVALKNGKKGTFSNEKGVFILKNVPSDAILEVSFTGYLSKEVGLNQKDFLSIVLVPSNSPLDEVQVIAYGTSTSRLNTGNVTTIKAEAIERQPVDNPMLALEGLVPGLFISQSTGLPGSGVNISIRGKNSMINGNDPLYVVDGVPYISQLLPGIGQNLGTSGATGNNGGAVNGNPLSYINSDDIESIEILKDADATAIYGSRAANGAVLITTKKGKTGQTRFSIDSYTGWGKVAKTMDLLNTGQYLAMRHEAINNDGLTTQPTDYDINGLWDTTRYTNWQKKLLGGSAAYSDIQGTLSGGNENTNFYLSGGYHRQTTVFPGSFSDQKGSFHANINHSSLDKKLSIQFSANYATDANHLQQTDLTNTALTLPSDAPLPLNRDGTLNWAASSPGSFSTWPGGMNPLSFQNQKFNRSVNNLISNAVISYKLVGQLEAKLSAGYTNMTMDDLTTQPFSASDPAFWTLLQRTASYFNSKIQSWNLEPQLLYKIRVSKGKLNALVGATVYRLNSQGVTIGGSGYTSDLLLDDVRSAATATVTNSVNSIYRYNALFGRITYDWLDKYVLNLTARRDGSSRFGPNNQFHNFGSAGMAWIFTRESFFERTLPFLSFGKITANYGSTGNDQIGDYSFLNLYTPISVAMPYQGITSTAINQLYNPNLQWEETKKGEIDLELGFLKDRILLKTDYYNNRSSNQLINYPLPTTTGFSSILSNLPATVENKGIEWTLSTVNVKSKHFSWSSSLNLSIPVNKLLSFPNLANSSYASTYIVGKPITILRVFHSLGVNDSTGIYQFADSKGQPTNNPNYLTDLSYINLAPKYYGGFQNSIRYYGIELDFLFQVVHQMGHDASIGFSPIPGYYSTNQPATVLARWRQPGDVARIQKFNSDYSLGTAFQYELTSDGAYSEANYIRLKNLSLSWQLPAGWLRTAHFQSCQLYFHGQNLLTFTRYKGGLDPENQSVTSLPPLRVFTFGLRLTL